MLIGVREPKCMQVFKCIQAVMSLLFFFHACLGVHACDFVGVHAGSEAEPRWLNRQSAVAGEHQPSNSASAAGRALAAAQKPQPAPTGAGSATSAAHAAELF